MAQLKGYEYFAHILKEYGTTHVFYQAAIMWMGVKKATELGITSIIAHSEAAAGYMADGYARITKRPGVCMAQSIGAAGLVVGIQDAWLATSPLIAITGRKHGILQYRNSYQESEHSNFFADLTKFNARITDPQQFPFLMRQCFREAVSGKPRPVHLELLGLDGGILEEIEMQEPIMSTAEFKMTPPFRIAAEDEFIAKAAKLIASAEKPVIIAGRGAMVSGAKKELCKFAKKVDIPVITTPDGKTLIDETDELWAGTIGDYGMYCANKIAMEADFAIFIGTQTSDQNTLKWKAPAQNIQGIQIDIAADELGRNYPNVLPLLGDAKTVLTQLEASVNEQKRPVWRKRVSELVADTIAKQEELMNRCDDSMITPAKLCQELSQALPDNAIVVADTGYSVMWSSSMLRMKQSQTYIRSAGSLGWAFPASLGVKCGALERPVICFTGDGGFFYHMQEMETAARFGLKTITVINNNGMLAQCHHNNILPIYGEEKGGLDIVKFCSIDYTKLAEEFGLMGICVEKPSELSKAMEKALAADTGVIIDVRTRCKDCPMERI